MVKTPSTRHSKPQREPVTIDLQPGEISRTDEAVSEAAPVTDATEAVEPAADAATVEVITEEAKAEVAAAASQPAADEKPFAYDFEPHPADTQEPPRDETPAEPKPTIAAAPEPKAAVASKRSGGSTLAAGLLGGVIALAGAGALQFVGLIGYPGGAEVAGSVSTVEADVAALKTEVAALKQGGAPDDGRVDGLARSLDQVKTDLAALQQAVQAGGAGDGSAVAALNAKIAEIEPTVAGLGRGDGGAAPVDLSAINEKLAGVEALAKAAGEAGSVVDGRLGALEQSVAALTAKVDAQASQPKIALAIASAALKSAIERGTPFQAEIETFAAVAPDAPDLPALRAYAENGVATRAEILAETDAAANAMIAAANPPEQDAGYLDRLLSSAESLVSVRPIGAVEGPGVPETVARMEAAIQSGDLAKALAEYDTLPEAAKAAGASLADKIKARVDAERLVDQAIASAMKA